MGPHCKGKRPASRCARQGSFLYVFLLGLWLLLPGQASAASSLPEEGPTVAVRRAMNEILYLLAELKDASRSAQRQWEIEQVVRRSFNYEAMAERSLGDAWNALNPVERRQYVRVFLQLLRDDVTDRLREYSSGQVAYLSETAGEDASQVVTAPAGPSVDTRIEFQVVRRPGGWILDDVICDGVSIVTNYQTQFSRILREGSFSDLMEHMKQKALIAQLAGRIDS